MYCSRCAAVNLEEYSFCCKCGSPLKIEMNSYENVKIHQPYGGGTYNGVTPTPIQTNPYCIQDNYYKPKKKRNSVFLVSVCILIALIIGLSVFIVCKNLSNSKDFHSSPEALVNKGLNSLKNGDLDGLCDCILSEINEENDNYNYDNKNEYYVLMEDYKSLKDEIKKRQGNLDLETQEYLPLNSSEYMAEITHLEELDVDISTIQEIGKVPIVMTYVDKYEKGKAEFIIHVVKIDNKWYVCGGEIGDAEYY